MFLFGKKADIRLQLSNDGSRKFLKSTDDKECLIYYDGESVSGQVNITVNPGKKLEHQGIVIELIGRVEFIYDRGSTREFLSLEKDLARPGILSPGFVSYPWEFRNVQKPYESYKGVNVHLRYLVRVHVLQRFTNIIREVDFEVQSLSQYSDSCEPLRMEVGIEDSLHIEFEYSTTRYHLEDVIIGKIYFILVRVKIKSMDMQIIRHETVGRGPSVFSESTYMTKYEIMDGAPVRGESIPVRIFLKDMSDLRPTMVDVANCFSVRYFLNLVLTDEEDRRYYKQQEIFLYRRCNKKHPSIAGSSKAVQSLIQHGHLKNFVMPSKPDIVETNQVLKADSINPSSNATNAFRDRDNDNGDGNNSLSSSLSDDRRSDINSVYGTDKQIDCQSAGVASPPDIMADCHH